MHAILPRVTLRRIIWGIAVLATVYVVIGVLLGSTDGSWKTNDWYSMIAGLLFFGVGASLAVAHEHQQERTKEILANQNLLLDRYRADQRTALLDMKSTMTAIREMMRVRHVPSVEAVEPASTTGGPATETPPPPDDSGELEGLDLSDRPPKERMLLERFAIEQAIIGAKEGEAAIRDLLEPAMVYVLGEPAGDISVPGQGTESNILHFTIDDEDEDESKEQLLVPIFTRADVLEDALIRTPDWQIYSVLEVNGGILLTNLERGVIPVVDPWSRFEFQLSPNAPEGPSADTDASELTQ